MTNTIQQLTPWVTIYLPLTSTIVVAVATVVLVLLTSRYVRLTKRMVEETQKSREPLVTVDFEIPDYSLRLVIENHGLSPAKNVRIVVLKDVQWLQGNRQERLADVGPIKDGVSYLTPARKLKYYLGFPTWKDNTPDEQMEASFRITYENEAGKQYENTVHFDFGQMREVLPESFKDSNLAVAEAIRDSEHDRQSHENTRQMFRSLVGRKKMKKCPMCAEMIPEEAKKCVHCQEMQEKPGTSTP